MAIDYPKLSAVPSTIRPSPSRPQRAAIDPLVRKLAAREKVKIVVAGDVLAKGRANAKGRFIARVAIPTGTAKVRVRAVGQFPALRSGSTTVRPS